MKRNMQKLVEEYESKFKADKPQSRAGQIYASDIPTIRDMAGSQEEAIMLALEAGYMMGYKRRTSESIKNNRNRHKIVMGEKARDILTEARRFYPDMNDSRILQELLKEGLQAQAETE